MEYVCNLDRTNWLLKNLRGFHKLAIVTHSFCGLETSRDRGLEHFYKSLLTQILECFPSLLPTARQLFVDECNSNLEMHTTANFWTLDVLRHIFTNLVSKIREPICFLIDGLGELQGDKLLLRERMVAKLLVLGAARNDSVRIIGSGLSFDHVIPTYQHQSPLDLEDYNPLAIHLENEDLRIMFDSLKETFRSLQALVSLLFATTADRQ